jgi:hypothetical protein
VIPYRERIRVEFLTTCYVAQMAHVHQSKHNQANHTHVTV